MTKPGKKLTLATPTFTEWIEDTIVILDMWRTKKDDLAVTATYLDEARRILEGALYHANRGE